MEIVLWMLPLLLGPPAIVAFVWLERLPTTRLLPFVRFATWPLAGRMCVFVFTLVICGHSLLLIPAMLAGLGDVASRLWMWQADAAILLVCFIAAVPAALGLGSPDRSVGAQLALWLCVSTAIACVTLGVTAVLPWSCNVDGPDCRHPAQHDHEKRYGYNQFINVVGRVGSLGAILGGFLSGLGAVLTPTQWVHRWQPSPLTTASGAYHAIRQVLALLPEEVSRSSALRGDKPAKPGHISNNAAHRMQHTEPAFAVNTEPRTHARHRNGNRNRGYGETSDHQRSGASAGFRHASIWAYYQEWPSSHQGEDMQQHPTAGQLMQLRQTTRLMASCAELYLVTSSEKASPSRMSASVSTGMASVELADVSSIGTRAGLEAAIIDLAGWDEQLDRAIEMRSGSWLGWTKSTAGMGLALVGAARACLAAFNLATGRRPERDPLTTAALLATRTMRAVGLVQSAGVFEEYRGSTIEVGEAGSGPGGGGSLLGWALETASLCVVATLVAVGLRGLVTNGRKLAAALGVGSTITISPTAGGSGGRAAVGPAGSRGKRSSKQPGPSLPKLLEGSPEQALDRLTEASARRRMAAGTLGMSAMWLALAMIPFTLGQLVLLRMQVPAWHRRELEAMLGPLRFGWFHAAFDAAFLVGIAVAGVSVWMSPSVSHRVAHDSDVVSGAAGAHAGLLGMV